MTSRAFNGGIASAENVQSFPLTESLQLGDAQPLSGLISALSDSGASLPSAGSVASHTECVAEQLSSLLRITADYSRAVLDSKADIEVDSSAAEDLPRVLSLASSLAQVCGAGAFALSIYPNDEEAKHHE